MVDSEGDTEKDSEDIEARGRPIPTEENVVVEDAVPAVNIEARGRPRGSEDTVVDTMVDVDSVVDTVDSVVDTVDSVVDSVVDINVEASAVNTTANCKQNIPLK